MAATLYRPGPETTGRGAALIASSVGGDRRRYAPFARRLAERGWTVATFDYRGIGGSRPADSASLCQWGSLDVEGALTWLAARPAAEQGGRLVFVGHSVAGQVLPLAPSHRLLDAVVLVASQAGWWRLRRGAWAWLVRGYFTATPAVVRLFGCLPLWPTGPERLPPGVALEWRRWCLEPEVRDLAGRDLAPRFAEVAAPILAYSFADDPLYSPRPAVEALLARYAGAPTVHRHVAAAELGLRRLGHRGFFDPALGGRLWPETVAFLEAERPAATGGASALSARTG